jgi:hypothetical protein
MRDSLSKATRWTVLGSLGRSYVGKLSALIPFVGYLIIFNPSFSEIFQTQIPRDLTDTPAWLDFLHSRRLTFLYFGLLFFGLAAGLFLAFSPDQIKRFKGASDYIADTEKVLSPAILSTKVDEVFSRFLRTNSGERAHPMFGHSAASFPNDASELLHLFVARLFTNIEKTSIADDVWDREPQGTIVEGSPYFFYTGSGHLRTDQILEAMYSGRLIDRQFLNAMKQEASSHPKELLYLEFFSLDYRSFSLRLIIAILFLCGFVLLLVPTMTTSLLVLQTSL